MEINENGLRPKFLNEFIGQKELIYKLTIYINVAKKKKEVLDHILFYGPSGCGKTTLANLIANEMGVNIKVINAANIEKPYELISVLLSLEPGDILFIDEMHTMVNAGAAEGAISAGDILKPTLARGNIKCIGATTKEEYEKLLSYYKEEYEYPNLNFCVFESNNFKKLKVKKHG